MDPQHPSGQPTPREGYVLVDGAALYYRDVGQGQPIIILHGGPGFDHNYLLPDMDRLAHAYRLIYFDQRGRGTSAGDVQPDVVSVQTEIDDLDAVCAYFQLDSVALLGHSWGGLLAMEYALRHPQHVSHLILLNTAPASHDDCLLFERERDANAPDDAALVSELISRPAYVAGDLEARAESYHAYFRATLRPMELLDRLVDHLQVGWSKDEALRARAIADRLWHETYESTAYDLLPKLADIRIPTLILHGDYDFVPIACAAHIAEAIPGARLVVLPDCGHFSYMERPDQVQHALDAFFAAV